MIKEKIKNGLEKIKKGLKYGVLAGLLLHAGSQLSYFANNYYQSINPSANRSKFEEQFGFRLKGWSDDIEGNPKNLSIIGEIVERERKEKDFKLESIRIRDRNYFKKSGLDQFYYMFLKPSDGYYIGNRITLDEFVQRDTIHHEIKHAKVFDLIADRPEFLEKWKSLAKDENGKSLYLSEIEQICSRVRGLDSLVNRKNKIFTENEKLGFISDYARTNVHEDIAELCESAETHSQYLKKFILDNSGDKNEVIAKKVALAQEYGLIPVEFTDFLKLDDMFHDSNEWHGFIDFDKAQPFMKESEVFLKKYPNSVYKSEIKSNRAYALYQGAEALDPRNNIEDAIKEYKEVLTSDYHDLNSYVTALNKLTEIYRWKLNDEETSNVFKKAVSEFWNRFSGGNVELPRKGVNDFLLKEGISLEK